MPSGRVRESVSNQPQNPIFAMKSQFTFFQKNNFLFHSVPSTWLTKIAVLICLSVGSLTPLLSQDTNLSNGFVFDGEPFLSVNPANAHHFVVAWMGFELNNNIVIKTTVTTNAGQTWSSPSSVPHTLAGHTSADPSIRWDHQGNAFLAFVDYNSATFATGAIQVVKSTDGGLSWGTPAEVISVADCPGKLCLDRPWMAIDTAAGPNQGNIYVTSMNAKGAAGNPPFNPYITRSIDGGASFEPSRFLDTLNWYAGSLITQPMPSPVVSANGTLHALYPSYVISQNVFPQNILATSTDGGQGFSHQSGLVLTTQSANDSLAKKGGLLLTNPADPNHLVHLHIFGPDGDLDIYCIETFDAGQTWGPDQRINDDPISNDVLQDMVWGDFDADGDLVITWRDRRNAAGTGYSVPTEMYAAVRWKDSLDFEPNIPISSAAANFNAVLEGAGNDFMGVELVDDTLSAAWGDVRTGTLSIWFTRMSLRDGMSSTSEIISEPMPQHIAYPNPTTGRISLQKVPTPFSYQIVDMNGKVVQSETQQSVSQLEVHTLPTGLYFLQWESQDQRGVFRISKEE